MESKPELPVQEPRELPFPVNLLGRKEWRAIRRNPGPASVIGIAAFIAGCLAVHCLYSVFIVPGKDSTIQSKQSEVEQLQRSLEKTRGERDENAIPLKKRGETLSAQLLEYAKSLEANQNVSQEYFTRFEGRVKRFVVEVDDLGFAMPKTQIAFRELLSVESVKDMAKEIESVTSKLK